MDIPAKLGIPAYDFRAVIGGTTIDYDLNKEEINRKKHGYSLESAVHMLERLLLPNSKPRPHFVSDAFEEKGEVRHMHLTMDDSDNVVLMVTTMRPNETVRVISFRRANDKEIKEFERLCLNVLAMRQQFC
jgi:uncharacterized DUF497 family protein